MPDTPKLFVMLDAFEVESYSEVNERGVPTTGVRAIGGRVLQVAVDVAPLVPAIIQAMKADKAGFPSIVLREFADALPHGREMWQGFAPDGTFPERSSE